MIRGSDEVAGESPGPKRHEGPGDDEESLPGLPNFPMVTGAGTTTSSSSNSGMNAMIESFQQMMLMQQRMFADMLKESRQSQIPTNPNQVPLIGAPPGLPVPSPPSRTAGPGEGEHEQLPGDADRHTEDPDVTALLDKQGSRRLSAAVVSKITSAAGRLRRRLHALARSEEHLQKLTGQLEELGKGIIPGGLKPFRLPWSSEVWTEKAGNLTGLIIPSAEADSLEFLKQKLHVEYLASSIILDRKAEELRSERLRQDSSLKGFILECMAFATSEYEVVAKTLSGTDAPKNLLTDLTLETKELAIKTYRKIVEKLALENHKEAEKRARQQRREKEALEAAAKLPAEEVVRRGLQEMCKKRMGKQFAYDQMPQVVDFGKLLKIDVDPLSTQTLQSVGTPKNGKSPADGQGQNQQKHYPKGKGRGQKGSKKQTEQNRTQNKGQNSQKGAGEKGRSKGRGSGGRPKGTSKGQWGKGTR